MELIQPYKITRSPESPLTYKIWFYSIAYDFIISFLSLDLTFFLGVLKDLTMNDKNKIISTKIDNN